MAPCQEQFCTTCNRPPTATLPPQDASQRELIDDANGVGQRVLGIAELEEAILFAISLNQALLLQAVCKNWQAVLVTSKVRQEAYGFVALAGGPVRPHNAKSLINFRRDTNPYYHPVYQGNFMDWCSPAVKVHAAVLTPNPVLLRNMSGATVSADYPADPANVIKHTLPLWSACRPEHHAAHAKAS